MSSVANKPFMLSVIRLIALMQSIMAPVADSNVVTIPVALKS